MKRQPNKALNEALDRLAALFPNGALLLATTPADLINAACDEIESARRQPSCREGR